MGAHGAAVLGSEQLKNYLVNFARTFIYTTALPYASLAAIKAAYALLKSGEARRNLTDVIRYFDEKSIGLENLNPAKAAIRCKIVPGNDQVDALAFKLSEKNLLVKAVKSPTVAVNSERIRICLHAFNTKSEIDQLIQWL
jgi:8-amino-7-oxononanoate synthase